MLLTRCLVNHLAPHNPASLIILHAHIACPSCELLQFKYLSNMQELINHLWHVKHSGSCLLSDQVHDFFCSGVSESLFDRHEYWLLSYCASMLRVRDKKRD
eukprot:4246703-Amphidinium_carterae.1